MTDAEMIAALADRLSADELKALAGRLKQKKREEIRPTPKELTEFETIWNERKKFTKRPGDPKKPALLKYCRQMRENPVSVEEILYGIRNEYGVKKDRPEFYCQMETFINQRRWENYDFAKAQAAARRIAQQVPQASNVVAMRPQHKTAFQIEWERQQAKKKSVGG